MRKIYLGLLTNSFYPVEVQDSRPSPRFRIWRNSLLGSRDCCETHDLTLCSVQSEALAFGKDRHRAMHVHHCRQSIFARDDRTVRESTTHLDDQATRNAEERRHAGIDHRRHNNVACLYLAPIRGRSHEFRRPRDQSSTDGDAPQSLI